MKNMTLQIKAARKKAGLTQAQMSVMFEIPIDTIKKWDSGNMDPPYWAEKLILEKLQQLAAEPIKEEK